MEQAQKNTPMTQQTYGWLISAILFGGLMATLVIGLIRQDWSHVQSGVLGAFLGVLLFAALSWALKLRRR